MTCRAHRRALPLRPGIRTLWAAGIVGLTLSACGPAPEPRDASEETWTPLFNGVDLTGWTPKIRGAPTGDNARNTFRVADGAIQVRYDGYETFDDQFGHLFYDHPFSHYRLVIEYRFVGDQAPDGPGWATRNSGVMLHAQDQGTMLPDQDFPISVEAQFLGGLSDGRPRSTANMCSPGTEIDFEGATYPSHCLGSSSATYDGDEWVRVEVVVLGDSAITHIVEGDTVLHYTRPRVGGPEVNDHDPSIKVDGTSLGSGYIALQSESHPIDFRRVDLLDLVGCTDPAARNFRSYFVVSAPSTCEFDGRP